MMDRKYFTKYNLELVKDESVQYEAKITSRDEAYKKFLEVFKLDKKPEEYMVMFSLNNKNDINGAFLIAKGGINNTNFSIQNIIKRAMLCNCQKILLAHNHPTGDPTPSLTDIHTTKRIKEACELMSIEFLDHFVIGENCFQTISVG